MSQEEQMLSQEIIKQRKALSKKRRLMANILTSKQALLDSYSMQMDYITSDIERLLIRKETMQSCIAQTKEECRDIYQEYRELAQKANYSIAETEAALSALLLKDPNQPQAEA